MNRDDVPPGARVNSRGYRDATIASPGRRDNFNKPTIERELAACALACVARRFGMVRVALRMLDEVEEERLLDIMADALAERLKAYRA